MVSATPAARSTLRKKSTTAPAPAVSAPGAGSTTGAPLAPLPSDRPPKDFPHWSRLVAAYNGVLVGGEKREFPTIELLGAEEVLSRIHWEHTKSKLYTPVGIGEILAKRTFSALGVVNTLAVKRNSGAPQQLRLVDGNIAVAEDRPFTPKGVWAVVDGITAIKWAWTLIGVGSEKAVEDYAKWWITKARLHSARIDAIAPNGWPPGCGSGTPSTPSPRPSSRTTRHSMRPCWRPGRRSASSREARPVGRSTSRSCQTVVMRTGRRDPARAVVEAAVAPQAPA